MNKKLEAFDRLLGILNDLREQCPWDRKQTKESLRKLTIEETYELADAIVDNDYDQLKEELGDLLMHIVFYARIGEEEKAFTIADVANSVCDKLVERHPHIYGNVDVNSDEEVAQNWEQLKMKEGKDSVLSGVPVSLPALIKAYRIQDKAKQVGFEWEELDQVWAKVEEEMQELKASTETQQKEAFSQEKLEDEFGDLMFAMVNYARFLNVDPETALERTNKKFIERFRYIEKQARENNRDLKSMSLNEMDQLWHEAKTRD
ncbi:MAG: nucleoside triphosphate pyrophosphohydrolase [Bacteroidetes bacterium SW_11_45_7]|nr:MAG: nucleoside triphosphate pyrophosphohydrolase [Bacteroidetes bacterium SW_11_45_7]